MSELDNKPESSFQRTALLGFQTAIGPVGSIVLTFPPDQMEELLKVLLEDGVLVIPLPEYMKQDPTFLDYQRRIRYCVREGILYPPNLKPPPPFGLGPQSASGG